MTGMRDLKNLRVGLLSPQAKEHPAGREEEEEEVKKKRKGRFVKHRKETGCSTRASRAVPRQRDCGTHHPQNPSHVPAA